MPYLVFTMLMVVVKGECFTFDSLKLGKLLRLLLLGDFDFLNAGHLWYMIALVYGYFILFMCTKGRGKMRVTIIAMLVLLKGVVGLFPNNDWHLTRNALFYGIPYLLLGYEVKAHESHLKEYSNCNLCLICIFSLMLEIATIYFDNYISSFLSCAVFPYSLCLFLVFLKYNGTNKLNYLKVIGKDYSGFVFAYHYLVGMIMSIIATHFLGNSIFMSAYIWIRAVIVFEVTLLLKYTKQEVGIVFSRLK